jgi:type I restriction enzyme S subunit
MVNVITDYIDIWTAAQTAKTNGRGRGNGNDTVNQHLYGIKKLRELILELAIRGKLVPHDPNDESASVLLEKIAKEKKRLVKEGKIKKQKPLPEIVEDKIPVELPPGWDVEHLQKTSWLITKGATPTTYGYQYTESGVRFVKVENIENGRITTDMKSQYIDQDTHNYLDRSKLENGDLLFSIAGTIGKTCIVYEEDLPANTNQALAIIRGTSTVFMPKFLLIQLDSFVSNKTKQRARGGAMNNVSLGDINELVLYIPPIAEQHRIVAKVDELMALCDQLEQQQTDSNAVHQTLVETLLATLTRAVDKDEFIETWEHIAENFDTLFTTEHSIDRLKQTILQLAVMGKLVPEDPNDEPASVLLEKIAKEKKRLIKEGKIKKQKPLPEISDDEKLFELREGWEWTRLTDLYYSISPSGKKLKSSEIIETGGFPVVDQGKSYIAGYTNNAELLIEIPNPVIVFGDHTTERKYIDFNFVAGADGTKILCPYKMDERYFYTYLLSYKIESRGYARHFKILNDNLMALPPLAEQHRIVAKVDELMAICDTLKARLNDAQTTRVQLADVIVEQAVVL